MISNEKKDINLKLKILNEELHQKYIKIYNGKEKIRSEISDVFEIIKIEKLKTEEFEKDYIISCIDGSVNRIGGSSPHYIDLFQALSKSTSKTNRDLYISEVYSPLLEEYTKMEDPRGYYLAKVEVEAAIEAINLQRPKLILMDGGLIRYKIYCNKEFENLREICKNTGTYLAGFIKEVKTRIISSELEIFENTGIYDKDILYGVLNMGEAVIIPDEINRKYNEGFSSVFLRTSNYPGIKAIDILNFQKEELERIAKICFSLTAEMSRGVPILIDIVDKEVKIDSEIAEKLVTKNLDKDLYERFFRSERSLRTY